MGADRPKQYLALAGATVLERTVAALADTGRFHTVLVVVSAGDETAVGLAGLQRPGVAIAAVGGATRRDSVLNGLNALSSTHGAIGSDWVWVHDAARPGLEAECIERLATALIDEPVGALLALPVTDTVKRMQTVKTTPAGGASSNGERSAGTVSREGLWLAQTPQVFPLDRLKNALNRHAEVTDEASAIEATGFTPRLVAGSRRNIKVTTMDDLTALRAQFNDGASMRIGQGWDVHALVPGRALVIGGVTIPFDRGLLGHSDADVLLHAITDALLGAAALGDIGRHFPDTDPRFAGADSRVLLRETLTRLGAAGWEPLNVDATVVAQAPKLAVHVPGMVSNIAADLGLRSTQVNVKAKTSERLGFAGRGEGIEAHALVMIGRRRG
jgi:2-C-methyl-D-erythritol 4-phosphate cytidylyltransferase/2-C-methyl-D-erythritol 2,4-cyclodiphosphate synthase